MPDLTPEQRARQQIDAQLVACGWVVQDYRQFNPAAGRGIALREAPLKSGTCDYLLLVDRKAVGVAEAKKPGTLLSGVAEQSGHYAENLPDFIQSIAPGTLPFLYESTGVETFFRDERDPEPRSRRVFAFHRPETLASLLAEPDTLRRRLAQMPIDHPLARTGMRDCQFEGNTALEESFARNNLRALVQMATGAGKTYLVCGFTYRLIKYANACRVLFLVDRANLGRQAMSEFQQFVAPDTGRKFTEVYNVQHLTSNNLDSVARVTICTIQRLYSILRGEDLDEDLDEKSGFEIAAAYESGSESGSGVPPLNSEKQRRDAPATSSATLTVWQKESFDHIVRSPASLEKFRQYIRAHRPESEAGLLISDDLRRDAAATLADEACAPFDVPALRDALAKAKQDAEQTIDTVTADTVLSQGFDAAAKAKAAGLVQAFHDYLAQLQAEIDALQILYSRPFKQRLTESMLKELEIKLRDNHAAWTEDRLWEAYALTRPSKVKGRSQAGRFADLVALVRFALEQQPVLAPFADSVTERFNEWLMDKAKAKQSGSGVPPLNSEGQRRDASATLNQGNKQRRDASATIFTAEQLAWLNLIRNHIATSLSIEPDDLELSPFNQRGGLGKAHQLFGEKLPALLDELNTILTA